MDIRKATIYDADALAALHREVITEVYGKIHLPAVIRAWSGSHNTAAWIARIEGSSTFLVAEKEGRIVGCGGLTLNRTGVYIHPAAHRQGIATRLLNDLQDIARSRGIYALELSAPELAVAFYQSAGFTAVAPNINVFANGSELQTYDMQKLLACEIDPQIFRAGSAPPRLQA